jgi:stage II sporulation protein D
LRRAVFPINGMFSRSAQISDRASLQDFNQGRDAMVCDLSIINPSLSRRRFCAMMLLLLPLGCSHGMQPAGPQSSSQRIRARIVLDATQVQISATDNISVSSETNSSPMVLQLPPGAVGTLSFAQDSWHLGGVNLGSGVLTIRSNTPGAISINQIAYRGFFRCQPVQDGKFDVINDVDVDDYLKGVVAKEMLPGWQTEAMKAQAIVARTYALYDAHSSGAKRYWDVFADTRSQVYGGIPGETARGQQAVDETAGIVLTYGDGDGKIFKAYFSSCCGGITQAAADAFPGDPYIPPLREQSNGATCNASHYFNWGPITLKKSDIYQRLMLWAQHKAKTEGHPVIEQSMKGVYRIDVVGVNSLGRPSHVVVTDTAKVEYGFAAEDLRSALDIQGSATPAGTSLPSSFCKINGDPNADSITFYDGHGFGHGVGMCQYCADEEILTRACPDAKLLQAY